MLPSHTTRSPGSRSTTPSPTDSTTPLHSWPGTTGKRTQRGSRVPATMSRSVRQTPARTLRTRTSPVAGSWVPRPRVSATAFGFSITMARMARRRAYDSRTAEWVKMTVHEARTGADPSSASSWRTSAAPVSWSSSPTTTASSSPLRPWTGPLPDTRLNAQRKAYTAARSDARSTAELADKARADSDRARKLRSLLHVLQGRGGRGRGASVAWVRSASAACRDLTTTPSP